MGEASRLRKMALEKEAEMQRLKRESEAEIARVAAEKEAEIERLKAQQLARQRSREQSESKIAADKESAELKAERMAKELETLRDEKNAEAARLQKIAAEKEAEIERLNAQIHAAAVAKEQSRDDVEQQHQIEDEDENERGADADEKDDEADREVAWCQCVGALYDEQTLRCTPCGKDWYIRSTTRISHIVGDGDGGVEVMQRLSDIESRASALYKMKLKAILPDLEWYSDFQRLDAHERALVMNMCSLLSKMRSTDDAYWQKYAVQNKWAQRLLEQRDLLMRNALKDAHN